MATSNGESGDENGQVWDGYSDFQTVSSRIGKTIGDAVDAYARVNRAHVENERVSNSEAGEASARILAAAMSLMVEMEDQRERNETVGAIYNRWHNGDSGDLDLTVPDSGFIKAFRRLRLSEESPEWMYQFVIDIRRAGWELGYLKAGRHEAEEPDDPVEVDAEAMFS